MKWILTMSLVGCCLGAPPAHGEDSAVEAAPIGPSRWILGGALAVWGADRLALEPRKQGIPPEGLDPEDIWPGLDRNAMRPYNADKSEISTWFLWATLVFPGVERGVLGEDSETWFRSLGVQLEAGVLTTAVTSLLKTAVSRPRPYAHQGGFDGSDLGPDWSASDRTFRSFPSGHAASAWASAMSNLSLAALNHADRPPAVHFASGVLAGGLAASTSLMRVEAGAHFPTDVLAGSLIGGGIGYALPFFHSRKPVPGAGRARTWGLLGTAAGIALGILLTPPTSPFVR